MMWTHCVFVLLNVIGVSFAQHDIIVTLTDSTTSLYMYDVVVRFNGDTVAGLAIWNPTDGTYDPNTCRTDEILPSTTNGTSLTISDVILSQTSFFVGGTEKFCTFEFDGAVTPNTFTFYVRTFQAAFPPVAGGNDMEFVLTLNAETGWSRTFTGSNVFTPGPNDPQVIPLTADVIVMNIETLDNTDTPQTTFNLGDTAALRFSLENTGYLAGTGISGARVTSCEYSSAADFLSFPTSMIGANGCFVSTDLFRSVVGGFSRHSSSAVVTGSPDVKTYYAHTPPFEVIGFHTATVGGTINIYIRCDVKVCFDDSTATVGTCGGDHCDPAARRRRSLVDQHATVSTNFTVVHKQDKEMPHPHQQQSSCELCSETGSYKVVMATLGTLTALLFAAMLFTYSSAQPAMTEKWGKKRQPQGVK